MLLLHNVYLDAHGRVFNATHAFDYNACAHFDSSTFTYYGSPNTSSTNHRGEGGRSSSNLAEHSKASGDGGEEGNRRRRREVHASRIGGRGLLSVLWKRPGGARRGNGRMHGSAAERAESESSTGAMAAVDAGPHVTDVTDVEQVDEVDEISAEESGAEGNASAQRAEEQEGQSGQQKRIYRQTDRKRRVGGGESISGKGRNRENRRRGKRRRRRKKRASQRKEIPPLTMVTHFPSLISLVDTFGCSNRATLLHLFPAALSLSPLLTALSSSSSRIPVAFSGPLSVPNENPTDVGAVESGSSSVDSSSDDSSSDGISSSDGSSRSSSSSSSSSSNGGSGSSSKQKEIVGVSQWKQAVAIGAVAFLQGQTESTESSAEGVRWRAGVAGAAGAVGVAGAVGAVGAAWGAEEHGETALVPAESSQGTEEHMEQERRLGSTEKERRLGSAEQERRLGSAEQKRRLGSMEVHEVQEGRLFFAERLFLPLHQRCGRPSRALWQRLRSLHLLPKQPPPLLPPHSTILSPPPTHSQDFSSGADWVVVVGVDAPWDMHEDSPEDSSEERQQQRQQEGQWDQQQPQRQQQQRATGSNSSNSSPPESRPRPLVHSLDLLQRLRQWAGQGRVVEYRQGSMRVGERRALFGRARLLVAAHGSVLPDMVFMPPGATVIELRISSEGDPTFHLLADACRLNYHLFLADSSFSPYEPSHPLSLASQRVQLHKPRTLLRTLRAVVARIKRE
ncbi:unnamed protein product [Closterium sp. NIES-53]